MTKPTRYTLIAALALAVVSPSAQARQKEDSASSLASATAMQHLEGAATAMGLPAGTDFVVKRTQPSDEFGMSHVRVDQFFHGVRVFGGELIVHVSDASREV